MIEFSPSIFIFNRLLFLAYGLLVFYQALHLNYSLNLSQLPLALIFGSFSILIGLTNIEYLSNFDEYIFNLLQFLIFLLLICIFIILFNYDMIPTRLILLTELVTAPLKDLTFDGLVSAINIPKFSVNIYFEKWVAISSGWFESQNLFMLLFGTGFGVTHDVIANQTNGSVGRPHNGLLERFFFLWALWLFPNLIPFGFNNQKIWSALNHYFSVFCYLPKSLNIFLQLYAMFPSFYSFNERFFWKKKRSLCPLERNKGN